jgi:5-formyltetrahydrofolate cyclo-ligase
MVPPEAIDLMICPCTVFDEMCNRMGMGGGYYDRFLAKCENAVVAAVAFEVQKAEQVPMAPWDKAVDLVFTEKKTYFKREKVSKKG